jgi:hypothetical protein
VPPVVTITSARSPQPRRGRRPIRAASFDYLVGDSGRARLSLVISPIFFVTGLPSSIAREASFPNRLGRYRTATAPVAGLSHRQGPRNDAAPGYSSILRCRERL